MDNLQSIQSLFGQTMNSLTSGSWPEFLKTAAWTYKYSFPDQLLIYAQRPDATACASIDVWNKRLGRTVKADAAHIALIDDQGDEIKLRYVIDVSDTEGSRDIPLWLLTAQNKEYVFTNLAASFDVAAVRPGENLTSFFERIARAAVEQQMEQTSLSLQRIQTSCEGLSGISFTAAETILQELLVVSVAETMMYRCNLVPKFMEPPSSLYGNLGLFRDPRALSILGQTAQAVSRDALLVAAKAAMDYDRTHKEEREYANTVSQSRGVQDPGPHITNDRSSEPIRENAQEVSAGADAQRVHGDDADRTDSDAPAADRGAGGEPVQAAADSAAGSQSGSGQKAERGGLDSAHDEASHTGGGNRPDEPGVRLTGESLPDAADSGIDVTFPTAAQQEAAVASSAGLLHIPQEEIDQVLTCDFSQKLSNREIFDFFASEPSSEEAEGFLKGRYDGLNDSLILPDGRYIAVEAFESGLYLTADDARGILSWETAAQRIYDLVSDGRYPVPAETQEKLPASSAELSEGQSFTLAGVRYLVTATNNESVILQDMEHPIFTTPMLRPVLDILLQNEAKAIAASQPAQQPTEPEIEPSPAEETIAPETSAEPSAPAEAPEAHSEPNTRNTFQERSETLVKRNYRYLTHYAPELMNGTLDYIRFESDGFEPLYIERIAKDRIAIAHTYTQNGDLMYDPEMVFLVNDEKQELYPLSYEQSDMQVYQTVSYSEDLTCENPRLANQLNQFFRTWSENLEWQDHKPVRGVKYRSSEDLEYTFGENRELITDGEEPAKETPAQPAVPEPPEPSGASTRSGLYVGDIVSFGSDDFQIVYIDDGWAYSVSERDGKAGVPMKVEQILAQIQGGGTTRLTHFWERLDYKPDRQDQFVLAKLLNLFETWRTSRGVYAPGALYEAAMERMSKLFVSEDEMENRHTIMVAAAEIRRWFPENDALPSRRSNTEYVLELASTYVDHDPSFKEMGNVLRLPQWRDGDEQRLLQDLQNLLSGPDCVYENKIEQMPAGVYFEAPDRVAQINAIGGYLSLHKPDRNKLTWQQQALYDSTIRNYAQHIRDIPALYPVSFGRYGPQSLYVGDVYKRDGDAWQVSDIRDGLVEMYSLETGEVGELTPVNDVFRSVRTDSDISLIHFWERDDYLARPLEIGAVFDHDGEEYRVIQIEGDGIDGFVVSESVREPGKYWSDTAGFIRVLVDEKRASTPDPVIAPEETRTNADLSEDRPFESSVHVGDYYEDIYGKGIVTEVYPEAHDGRHRPMFTYVDPEAEPGSRAAKGYVMSAEAAEERIRTGKATLIPASEHSYENPSDRAPEPTLFDFDFSNEKKENTNRKPVAVNAVPDAQGRINYRISTEPENYGGPKARFRNNIEAIRLLKSLEEEGRLATQEEQKILSRYVGWGGISQAFDANNTSWEKEYEELKELLTEEEYESAKGSTLTAFYTPPEVTEAIYTALQNFGFTRGNILDPCCGTGNFFGMLPDSMAASKLYGVELDSISGRISRQLYQQANILIEGYEKTNLPDSFYDVAVGNVPFGQYKLHDRKYDKENFLIHDYFFAKTLDKVRPGGIVAFITSKGTMDKANDSVRRYIAQRADLLGAIRLPNNTFKDNAGTEAVADILFLKKRSRPMVQDADWLGLTHSYLPEVGKWGPEINQYFFDNPEMILGDLVEVSGPHGPELTCVARKGEDLRQQLQEAVANISGQIEISMDELEEGEQERKSIPADPNVRNYSFTVVDGDIYFREDSQMYFVELNKTAEQRVKGLIGLRDITRKLIDAQLRDEPDAVIFKLQQELNDAYDKFKKKFGIINSRANDIAFSDDSSYFLLCSLEHIDDEGNFLGKADMFYKRTIGKHTPVTQTETAQEALAVSMGEKGKVDLGYICRLCGKEQEEAIADLRGLIFPVPGREGEYELSSIYLSGNVRKKLAEAREAAKADPRFAVNAEYLESVMPEPLEPEDISVRLGATWIPQEDISDFIHELLDFDSDWLTRGYKDRITAIYEPVTDSWTITNKHWDSRPIVYSTYGTDRAPAYRLIEDALNQKNTQIFDTVEDAEGKVRRVLNAEETIAARDKQEQIKEKFKEWIWSDPARANRLSKLYNERFNSIVPPVFDPNMVVFHGMNPLIQLEDHQKESVARILYSGNTQLAHEVGAGKTWTMVAAAMEAKHLGLCNKSLVVVPNHLVGQWASAIYQLYPSANILASTKKDFETKNRKKFCSRIATGDYDIVVIAHSQFERIPLSAERQEANLRDQIADITDSISSLKGANAESFSIKQMERMKKQLTTKLEKLQNGKRRDDVVTFEELGTDRLFVDESHEFKNLFLYTKMHNVAGISQTDSQKASDLFMKSRYMDELTGNMGNIHATGTPLSNTMAELYTTQRYLQYDLLQEMGLGSFDAWASTFGETVQSLELAPEGTGYRERTRFANFFNIPELVSIYKQVADVRPADVLNLPVPDVEYHVDVVPASQEQKEEVQKLAERADNIRKRKVTNKEDNMLCITNDGRKLALDQRLINPDLPDNPNSKANKCAENILKYYREGEAEKLTQLVFCDLSTPKGKEFNVYQDLKDKLVAAGIPEEEIRFIHEANTDAQKEALFAKVRAGTVRVLMGSTSKMGTGTNVQDRLIALHDLDCPWRPSDLQQRAGRGVRRGNRNEKVHVHRYVTENTFDAYLYQLIEAKQRFASQIFTSKSPVRVAADVDESVLNYSQIKALASGNPKVREKIELEIELERLKTVENNYKREQRHLAFLLKTIPSSIEDTEHRLSGIKEDLALATGAPSRTEKGELLPAEVQGVTYDNQTDAGNAIFKVMKHLPEKNKWYGIGNLRGFRILARQEESHEYPQLSIAGKRSYAVHYGDDPVGLMVRLNNILDYKIDTVYKSYLKDLEGYQRDLQSAKAEYGKPFASADLIRQKRQRLKLLEAELNLDTMEKEKQHELRDTDAPEAVTTGSLSDRIAAAQRRSEAQQANQPTGKTGHIR